MTADDTPPATTDPAAALARQLVDDADLCEHVIRDPDAVVRELAVDVDDVVGAARHLGGDDRAVARARAALFHLVVSLRDRG